MWSIRIVSFVVVVVITAGQVTASDVVLPIAGSVGSFRTDVRIFNPSLTKAVTVEARFLPIGNTDNSARFDGRIAPVVLTIPERQAAVFNDAVTAIFGTTGLGAIYLSSANPILVTSRIYAQTASGTLGQGFNALDVELLVDRGVLLQLRADSVFRTNAGVANVQNAVANVTWSLYDNKSVLVSKRLVTMPPYAVIGPTSIAAGFFFDASGADLSDAWVTFSSDIPLAAYASIVDNITTDPTYLPAQADPAAP